MQQLLITRNDVIALSRSMSQYIDSDKVETFIRESENIDIKSALGDELFLDVKEHPENYKSLLDGDIYETSRGEKRIFSGLKTSLAYYTYARLVKSGDGIVSRFSFANKDSDYSSRSELKEKVMAYNDAFSVADRYLKECVRYLNDCRSEYPLYKGRGQIKANRTVFRILGE